MIASIAETHDRVEQYARSGRLAPLFIQGDALDVLRRCPSGFFDFAEECEVAIPEARRQALPGVRFCVRCQSELEKGQKAVTLYNRSGSKDSQLK